ncbi:MAG: BLUF domain-containing protein [Myxococcales bacterium]|nr:BLUF domain-containing protein [Myxococcales bacterium]
MLTRLKYVSRFARPMSPADVQAIVEAAQRHNATIGVTGMLLAFGEVFMQVIEGPTEAVRALFGRIVADPRHRDVILIRSQRVDRAIFAGWSMRLLELDAAARREAGPLLVLIDAASRGGGRDADLLRDIDDMTWRTLGERVVTLRPTG